MKYIITSDLLQLGVAIPMFEVDVPKSEIENVGDAVHCEFFINKNHIPVISERLLDMMGITINSGK